MRSQKPELCGSTCYFLVYLTLTLGINSLQGIRRNIPSQITRCTGQTAQLTWEYVKEANEEIRQFQWRVNTTTLIAYSSEKNGFTVDPKYQGKVEKLGVSGILLKNISTKDVGNYTLYPVISWKESPIMQSIWLNVIDEVKIQQWCTCEGLLISPKWSGGRTFTMVSDGCSLEINSSFCCQKGPAIQCMENDPHTLCVPIRDLINLNVSITQGRDAHNLTDSATESRIVPEQITPTVLQKRNTETYNVQLDLLVTNTSMISLLVIWCLMFVLWRICRNIGLNRKSKPPLSSSYHPCGTI